MIELSLSQLKRYLKNKSTVSLKDICSHFQVEQQYIEPLLYHFIQKGQLQQKTITANCGTRCHQCAASEFVLYHWRHSETLKAEKYQTEPLRYTQGDD